MVEERARFAPELECVAEARRFVRRVLAGWGLDRVEPHASLLVTELATNSVLHARTEFQVTVVFDDASLRLGVSDGSRRAPTAKARSRRATTGRGLGLIAAFADSWHVEPHPGGKTVWCVVAHRKSPELADASLPDDATGRALERLRPLSGASRQAGNRAGRHRSEHRAEHRATARRRVA